MRHTTERRSGLVRDVQHFMTASERGERGKKISAIAIPTGHLAVYAAERSSRGRRDLKMIGLIHNQEDHTITFDSRTLHLPAPDENSPVNTGRYPNYPRSISYHPELATHAPTTVGKVELQLIHNLADFIVHSKHKHDALHNPRAHSIATEVILANYASSSGIETYADIPPEIIEQFVSPLENHSK